MVIQTNEKEFKGKTLQEYLEWKYPEKEDKEKVKEIENDWIDFARKLQGIIEELEGGELDLSEFKNIEKVVLYGVGELVIEGLKTPITKLNVNGCANLKKLYCEDNELTSIDFLNQLSHPEKLENLSLFNNKIQPTDISIFSKFVNLKELKIGTTEEGLEEGKNNKFYGSLKSYQNLVELKEICIEATDVDSGLEYLPTSLAQKIFKGIKANWIDGGYLFVECFLRCSTHDTDAKCKVIQNQLRPFDYDLEAWQLAHPNKMYKARPELFEIKESREKWLSAVITKIEKSESKLSEVKQNEPNKVEKIKRMELKIDNLNLIKQLLEQRSVFEESLKTEERWYDKFKEDKATQTELTEEVIQELREQMNKYNKNY